MKDIHLSKFLCMLLTIVMVFSACGAKEPVITETQIAYEDMTNAEEYLSLTNKGYTFKDYPISNDGVIWIGDELAVSQGIMYEEIAATLSLYCKYGLSAVLDDQFFQVLIGSTEMPNDWDVLSEELYSFIAPDGTERLIISKLETLDCVEGTFDYDTRNYEFEITNIEKAAEELQISQEMLGYVLAKLNEYTDDIVFNGNSVTCSLEVKTYQ